MDARTPSAVAGNQPEDDDQEHVPKPMQRGFSRFGLLKTATAILVGASTAPFLGRQRLLAAGLLPDQQPSFQALGPAPESGTAFDATAMTSGAPTFSNGVQAQGTQFGVKGFGPATGVYGAGGTVGMLGVNTANGTGVLGASYTDVTQAAHGKGAGVQGDSGSGFGVAGFSNSGPGLYGQSNAVGVSGQGPIGVQGLSPNGTGVVGKADAGTGIEGTSITGSGVVATNTSPHRPTISATNSGSNGAVHGSSLGGYGVLGSSTATPGAFGQGSGVVGNHTTGYGVGVAGFSVQDQRTAHQTALPLGTGVFGLGDGVGIEGHSVGVGVRGANVGGGTGMLGVCFKDGSQTTHGSGAGVQGNSGTGSGVAGFSESGTGVHGQSGEVGVSGRGSVGLRGEGLNGNGVGVEGNVGPGIAVKGSALTGTAVLATNNSGHRAAIFASNGGSESAVHAISSHGYGAELNGGRAALRLVPTASKGHPRGGSHEQGELIMDASGKMFVCVTGGRPGVWRQMVLR